jgi:predicted NAD-dependent protein-ADP-ribosyltransferase YbiA (DUF1768 family)
MTIQFYGQDDAYGEFSNFAPFPIRLDGQLLMQLRERLRAR